VKAPAPRAIVFDLDGTVVDSHRYTFAAFRFASSPYRPPPSDAEVFAAFGPSERVILASLVPAHAGDAYRRLQEYYARHAAGVEMHPEMRPLLRDLRDAGVRLGLFTGRGADSTELLLRALELEWAFEAVVSGDAAHRPKPAPDGVLHLLRVLGSAPNTSLVVGDSPLDLEAARSAATPAAFAAWHAFVEPPAGALVLPQPDALRPLVGLLDGRP
jgi:HAD superfamily hydrolase (TIGR01509 family)